MTTRNNLTALESVALSEGAITTWVGAYVTAWKTNSRDDIAALFTEDAEYHESPYTTEWLGREAIIAGWQGRWEWQAGGWEFEWTIESVDGVTVVIVGVGHYARLGNFENRWTVTFDESGRCVRFEMINNEIS